MADGDHVHLFFEGEGV